MTKFAERLKELRLSLGMSVQELAKETKFATSSIYRWEAGVQIPNLKVAIVFIKFFNVSLDYLLGLKG